MSSSSRASSHHSRQSPGPHPALPDPAHPSSVQTGVSLLDVPDPTCSSSVRMSVALSNIPDPALSSIVRTSVAFQTSQTKPPLVMLEQVSLLHHPYPSPICRPSTNPGPVTWPFPDPSPIPGPLFWPFPDPSPIPGPVFWPFPDPSPILGPVSWPYLNPSLSCTWTRHLSGTSHLAAPRPATCPGAVTPSGTSHLAVPSPRPVACVKAVTATDAH